jgi:hypothetical protein
MVIIYSSVEFKSINCHLSKAIGGLKFTFRNCSHTNFRGRFLGGRRLLAMYCSTSFKDISITVKQIGAAYEFDLKRMQLRI